MKNCERSVTLKLLAGFPVWLAALCMCLALAGSGRAQTIPPISYPIPDAVAGVSYAYNFGAGLPDASQLFAQTGITFSFSFATTDTLPPGLALDSSGQLAGTPTSIGSFSFTVNFVLMYSESGTSLDYKIPLAVTMNVDANKNNQSATVDPAGLQFPATQGETGLSIQQITIDNPTGQTQNFSVSESPVVNYLTISPYSGQIAPYSTASFPVTFDPSNLIAGTYLTTLSVAISPVQESFQIPVLVTVNSAQQSIGVSQTGLQFGAVQGGLPPAAQTMSVLSEGAGPIDYSAVPSTTLGAGWLSVTPASGAIPAGGTAPVQISVDPTGLAPGTYYGQITVSAPGVPNSWTTAVVLNVTTPQNSPGPTVSTAGLLFVGAAGGSNPNPQTVHISNPSPSPVAVSTTISSGTATPFFTAQTSSPTVMNGSPIAVTVQPSLTGLAPGVYRGEIDLHLTDPQVTGSFIRRIAVVFVVTPASGVAGTAPATRRSPLNVTSAATCTPSKLVGVFTQLGGGFNVSAGWPVPLEMLVSDDCGSLLNDGSVVATFSSGDPALSMTSLGSGQWASTWTPHGVSASQVTVTGTSTEAVPPLTGTTVIGGGLQPNPGVPVISQGGVVSAASVTLHPSISPGGFISIYGASLSAGQFTSQQLPFATNLGGTEVFLAGQQLPLQIAFDGQINAIVPYTIPINTQTQIFVQQSSAVSAAQTIVVAPASPAVFQQLGGAAGIIVDFTNQNQLIDATHPAAAGDVLIVYCSGLGAVTNPPALGAAAVASPLSQTVNNVTAMIGGQNAAVFFAGLAPGYAGLYQVNAQIPSGVTPGTAVPVVLSVAGEQSTPVTINVH